MDQETCTKVNGSGNHDRFPDVVTVMKCQSISLLKPLSMQLEKRESDTFHASSVKSNLKALAESGL